MPRIEHVRADSRALRVFVALVGLAVVAAGVVTREHELVTIGGTMLGWVLPWLREIALDRGVKEALQEIEQGHPREAQRRLRRVSHAPPSEGQG